MNTESIAQPVRGLQGRLRINWSQVFLYLFLTFGAVISFAPFFWMVTSAFKTPGEITGFPPVWIPRAPTFDNVVAIWHELDFARYFANSAFITITTTALSLFTSSLVGYVLAKLDFWGRDLLFLSLLATMMIPYLVTLVPSYQLMKWLRWINSYWALIVPSLYSAYGIFLVRQYMHSIPDELLDAGRIDGASEGRIFLQLILPLCKPMLSALGIFFFMWQWDSFMWPSIVLNDQKKYTLPVGLATFQSEFVVDHAKVMAGAAISVLPTLVVFLLLQKHFVAGVALTGLKG